MDLDSFLVCRDRLSCLQVRLNKYAMRNHKSDVPRMKETSQLERELKSIIANSFNETETMNQIMKIIKEDREAMIFEIGTFVLSPRDSSYSSQVNYVQTMRNRIKN
jgi:hypothetical protein